mgnify:CR=1 FL=1
MVGTQVSVLLVDDSPNILRILADFVSQCGQGEMGIVGTALGGREALRMAQALRPQVIVIDLAMPDLPGLDAIPLLRQILPTAKIVALTLFDSESYRQAALAAGANDFVSKARLETELLPAILGPAGRPQPRAEPTDASGPGQD